MDPAVWFAAGWVAALAGVVRLRREPRRLSTGFLLLAAAALTGAGAGLALARWAASATPVPASALLGAAVLATVLIAGITLLLNGILVTYREGVLPATLTPMVVGLGLLALPAAAALALWRDPALPGWLTPVATVVALIGGYLVVHLLAFTGHALVYRALPDRTGADAIVVLGCALQRDRVTPLLAARLDRAMRMLAAERAAGRAPLLVTSGGTGSDEALSEADAMASYLVDRGVPDAAIVRERHSRNTGENLRNSIALLRERLPAEPRVAVVTSDFHVLRTAALTRRLGIDAHVAGARTARWFVPAAFLREFAAVLTTHYRRTHTAVAAVTLVALTSSVAHAYLAA